MWAAVLTGRKVTQSSMLHRFRYQALALLSAVTPLLHASPSMAGWESDVAYGGNMPTDLYVPDEPAESPAVVVSLHYCSGNKGNAHSWFESYAAMYGFVIITPQAGGNCFDASPARGGERAEIVKMVDYAVAQYGADTARVFAAGASSGACMTQALLAAYPEVFAAGSSLAGVPAGAWTGGNAYGWSTPNQSAQQWGDKVRQVNPDFSGPWPRIQLWHGQGDTTLTYSDNYPAQVAQWTNVWGVTDANATSEMIQPMGANDTWSRTSYESAGIVGVEANSAGSNVPHDLSGRGLWADVVRFFGLDMPAEPTTSGAGGTSSGAGGTTAASGSTTTGPGTSGGISNGNTGTPTTSMGGISSATTMTSSSVTTTGAAQTTGVGGSGTATTAPATTVGVNAASTTANGQQSASTTVASSSGAALDKSNDEEEGGCTMSSGDRRHSGLTALSFGILGLLLGRRRRSIARQ